MRRTSRINILLSGLIKAYPETFSSSLSDIFFLSVGPHPKQTIFVQLYTVYKVIEEYLVYDYGCFKQLIESVE